MKRLKMALKTVMVPFLIGVGIVVLGLILLIIGAAVDVVALIWVGIIVALIGAGTDLGACAIGRNRMRAICPECNRFMGDTHNNIPYSYQLKEYETRWDTSTNKVRDYKYYYLCTITCPHCGNETMFEQTVIEKTNAKADIAINKYLRGLLKITE